MSEKSRYFKIGIFFIASMGLLCAGLAMFGAGYIFKQAPVLFETCFDQSVHGLDIGAPVKFRGVRVGEVKEIRFAKEEYEEMLTIANMKEDCKYIVIRFSVSPLKFPRLGGLGAQQKLDILARDHGLRAKLSPIGISGLNYLEIDFVDPKQNPILEINWKPKRLYIPSAVSMLSRLGTTMDDLARQLNENIYPMLDRLNRASTNFPEISAKLGSTLTHMEAVSRNVEEITSSAKKYPAQLIFGEAPPKSRYGK